MDLILLACVWDKTTSGTVRSMKRVEADLLLAVLWDATTSGTARSKTGVLLKIGALNSCSEPCFSMGQKCSSLSQTQSRPTQKRGASVLRGSPCGENCVCGILAFLPFEIKFVGKFE